MHDARNLRTDGLLLLTSAIWGFAFVAQRAGMETIGPFTYNGVRFLLGTVTLLPLSVVIRRRPGAGGLRIRDALIAGVLLFLGSSFQQVGLVYTTAGKAGFITGSYVVLVPIVGTVAGLSRTGLGRWLAVFLALAGLYLLSIREGFTIGRGDALVALSAVFFALHVLYLAKVARRNPVVPLAVVQFFVTGVFSLFFAVIVEAPQISPILETWLPILYGGCFSVGIAYSLQVVAQRTAHPTHAAIILSLEGAFAALGGFLLLSERLSVREAVGCGVLLLAMLLSQLAVPRRNEVMPPL
ncbi:MAG: DMT family transporter [Spirochaetota bacterium]